MGEFLCPTCGEGIEKPRRKEDCIRIQKCGGCKSYWFTCAFCFVPVPIRVTNGKQLVAKANCQCGHCFRVMSCPGCQQRLYAWPGDWFQRHKIQNCDNCGQSIGSNVCTKCGKEFLQVCDRGEISEHCDTCTAGSDNLPGMLRAILTEFLRPLGQIPDDLQLAVAEKKSASLPQLTTKEIQGIVQAEVRAVYDLVQIVNEEVGNSSTAMTQAFRGINGKKNGTLGKIVEIVSRTEKQLGDFAAKQSSPANARTRAEDLPTARDVNPKQLDAVEIKLVQLKEAVDQLRVASNTRATKTAAAVTHDEQSPSGKLIPVAALSEWLASLNEDPLRRLVNSLPRMFNICDSLFRQADSTEDASGLEMIAELKKARTLIVNWQESVGIHRVPAAGDLFDSDLARIVERVPTDNPTDHNHIKEVRKFGYLWVGAEEWQLQKGEVVVWNFGES